MKKDFTKGDILKHIVKAAWPIVLAMFFQTSFGLVDLFFVSRISDVAIAAISMAFPVMFFLIALSSGVSIGTTSFISRLWGKKNYKKAGKVASNSLISGSVVGILLSIFGYFLSNRIFSFMGAEGELLIAVVGYAKIIFLGLIFMFILWVLNGIFRGMGEMITSMKIMSYSAVLNLLLDPLFIFVLDLGLEGAAIASVLSRLIGVLIGFYYISKEEHIKLKFKEWNYKINKEIFRVGLPASLANVSNSIGFFVLTMFVARFGVEAVAGFGVGARIDSFVFLPLIGIGGAVMSIVGQNVGVKNLERVKETVKVGNRISLGVVLLLMLLILPFSRKIIGLFSLSVDVVNIGMLYLVLALIGDLFFLMIVNYSSAFEGAGLPLPAFVMGFLRSIVLLIPLSYIGGFVLGKGLLGIWIGGLIAICLSGLIGFVWFNFVNWWDKVEKFEVVV
ncbi:hypothetical protein CL618_01520 [archaeon]|nr:hypothetical protein [archaeon]|tara:strand:+ start:625 stop:1965 length:1341 start_codon:yes stop_codon:yes gene_type:complete